MQSRNCSQALLIGLFLFTANSQTDLLTAALNLDLAAQCRDYRRNSCVLALRFHGQGQDGSAMDALLGPATPAAKVHYGIGKSLPKDKFWVLVARAGADAGAITCTDDLSGLLDDHFALNPRALADAADDSLKNKFLALSDLLSPPYPIPAPASPPLPPDARVQIYRYCFYEADNLFDSVKNKLGR